MEMTCGLPIELLCLAILVPTGNIVRTPYRDKHFLRRCQGVPSVLVDPKRYSGNLKLHCKSGKSSSLS